MKRVSKVLNMKNLIAFCKNLISFSAQVKFLSDVAHIKKFFTVFLQQEWTDIKVSSGYCDKKWPVNHTFGDKDSPAHEYICDEE
jgi:hypothetical protein